MLNGIVSVQCREEKTTQSMIHILEQAVKQDLLCYILLIKTIHYIETQHFLKKHARTQEPGPTDFFLLAS